MMNKFEATVRGAFKSWTIWLNALVAGVIGGLPLLQDSLPALQPYVGADLYRYGMGTIVALNIALRFKTNCGLHEKGSTHEPQP